MPAGLTKTTSGTLTFFDVTRRGNLWFTQSVAGTADKIEVCAKNALEVYVWVAL